MKPQKTPELHPETLAVRAGIERSQHQEHSEALFLTSSFVQENAEQAARMFSMQEMGYTYSRTSNPTVAMFEKRIAVLEGSECAIATNNCMSAVLLLGLSLLKAGDHVLCSRSVFGSTLSTFSTVFSRFGIETTFVSQTDLSAWQAAIRPNTQLLFAETPSNPLLEICDIQKLALIAHKNNALLAVDNTFCTPILQRPIALSADFSLLSGTKFLDGQGRTLSGVICTSQKLFEEKLWPVARTIGSILNPFNAWLATKGLETLSLRIKAESATALTLANFLNEHRQIARVHYPGLPSHGQYELAQRQQAASGQFLGGALLTFEIKHNGTPEDARAKSFAAINKLQLFSRTTNLGDVKSIVTHPASTSHAKLSEEQRQVAGVTQGLIRLSCGLEHVDDLMADLKQALA